MKWKCPELRTNRLLLRPLNIDDAQPVFDYASDPQMVKGLTWKTHRTIEDSKTFINASIKRTTELGLPDSLAIVLLNDSADSHNLFDFHDSSDSHNYGKACTCIGTIGAFWKSQLNEVMEIGYAVSRKYWGQGIATEAVQVFVKWLFENYSVSRIQALTTVDNAGSAKVLLKVGFQYEGRLRNYQYIQGELVDMNIYSLLSF